MKLQKKYKRYPFLILLLIHIVILYSAFRKSSDRKKLFVMLTSNIGLAYLFEYFVLNLYNGYQYKPSLFKNKQVDNIFGAILSQALFVPFTATFITVFKLGWFPKIIISMFYSLIEIFFVKMDVYKQRWWKTGYTFLLLPVYFTISDKWYEHLNKGTPVIQFLTLFHLMMVTCVNILFVKAILQKFKLGFGIFHSFREHFKFVGIYSIFFSLLSTTLLLVNKHFGQWLILCIRLVGDYILLKKKWLKGTNIVTNLPQYLFMALVAGYFKELIYPEE